MGDDSTDLTEYTLTASRMSPKRTAVDTGDAEFVVGNDVNPVEYFLGSILACLNSTGTMVARDMDLEVERLEATIDGGVDYSRYMGRESTNRPGLKSIEVSLEIDASVDGEPASEATLETWRERVEDRCPVTDNVANESHLDVTVDAI